MITPRIAAASNEDDDEELSSHIPIPEDDDGHSYHSSDEESGNEEELAVATERKVTTPSGWQYTAGPDPCRNGAHTTVGVSKLRRPHALLSGAFWGTIHHVKDPCDLSPPDHSRAPGQARTV